MRVVVIDDDAFVTTSLTTILNAEEDIEIVGIGNDGKEAVALYEQLLPDILLMDIQMGEMSGLDAAKHILDEHKNARIVFLTTFADDDYIVTALRMGAKGYLIKQEVATIAPSLRTVLAGQNVMGSEVLKHVDNLMNNSVDKKQAAKWGEESQLSDLQAKLSEREFEIVELIATGYDNREIAGALYISEGTVRNHISAILTKLELKNRTQLAILYYQG